MRYFGLVEIRFLELGIPGPHSTKTLRLSLDESLKTWNLTGEPGEPYPLFLAGFTPYFCLEHKETCCLRMFKMVSICFDMFQYVLLDFWTINPNILPISCNFPPKNRLLLSPHLFFVRPWRRFTFEVRNELLKILMDWDRVEETIDFVSGDSIFQWRHDGFPACSEDVTWLDLCVLFFLSSKIIGVKCPFRFWKRKMPWLLVSQVVILPVNPSCWGQSVNHIGP